MPDDDAVSAYPTHWEADVVLRDGGTAHVRPIRPDDADRLQAFHVGQSERSTYFRFFAPLERLPERDLARFTQVDHVDRVALVAVASGQDDVERILAVARYDRSAPGEAEVAFMASRCSQEVTLTQKAPVSRMLARVSLVPSRSALAEVVANITWGGR